MCTPGSLRATPHVTARALFHLSDINTCLASNPSIFFLSSQDRGQVSKYIPKGPTRPGAFLLLQHHVLTPSLYLCPCTHFTPLIILQESGSLPAHRPLLAVPSPRKVPSVMHPINSSHTSTKDSAWLEAARGAAGEERIQHQGQPPGAEGRKGATSAPRTAPGAAGEKGENSAPRAAPGAVGEKERIGAAVMTLSPDPALGAEFTPIAWCLSHSDPISGNHHRPPSSPGSCIPPVPCSPQCLLQPHEGEGFGHTAGKSRKGWRSPLPAPMRSWPYHSRHWVEH